MPGHRAYPKTIVDHDLVVAGDLRHDPGVIVDPMHVIAMKGVPMQVVPMEITEMDKAVIVHTQAKGEVPSHTMSVIGEAKARPVAGSGRQRSPSAIIGVIAPSHP
jgi:hypothetical protein